MIQEVESAAPVWARRRDRTRARIEKTPALQASCLTAGLMTAFAVSGGGTAGAQIITSQGNELFGVTFAERGGEGTIKTQTSSASRPLSSAPGGPKGIVVFADTPEEYASYIGSEFEANFGVAESSVVSYIEGNTAYVDSYNAFLANIPENFLLNSTYSFQTPYPNYAVLFSGGIGLGAANIPFNSVPLNTNFGAYALALEPAAVTPEPGTVVMLLAGGVSLLGHGLLRRRKQRGAIQ